MTSTIKNIKHLHVLNLKTYSSIIILSVLFYSCSKDLKFDEKAKTVLHDNVNVMDEELSSLLIKQNENTISFENLAVINDIEVGDILVSDVTEVSPGGYLKKILSKEVISDRIVFTTTNASLVEVFKHCDFSYCLSLSSDKTLKAKSFKLDLDEIDLGNGFNISGSIDLNIDLIFSLKIDSTILGVEFFELGYDVKVKSRPKLQYAPQSSGISNGELEIREWDLIPVTIPTLAPIVIYPELELSALWNATGPSIGYSLNINGEYKSKFQYQNSVWDEIHENSIKYDVSPESIELSGFNGEFALRTKMEFDIYLSKLISIPPEPFIFGDLYSKLEVNTTECLVETGFRVGGGLELGILEKLGFGNDEITMSSSFPITNVSLGKCLEVDECKSLFDELLSKKWNPIKIVTTQRGFDPLVSDEYCSEDFIVFEEDKELGVVIGYITQMTPEDCDMILFEKLPQIVVYCSDAITTQVLRENGQLTLITEVGEIKTEVTLAN